MLRFPISYVVTPARASEPLRSCTDDGYLVPASCWLPNTHFDHQFLRWGPRLGCARLACTRCGAPVKSAANLRPSWHASAADTWDAIDDGRAKGTLSAGGRMYTCRCQLAAIHAEQAVSNADGPAGDLSSWRCAGHAPLSLPAVVDGIAVDDAADLGALARAVFIGAVTVPVHPSLASVEAFWLLRLFSALSESARRPFALAVNALLLDDDPRVRAGALRFFCRID
jgi:hypothetical protein